MKTVKVVAAIIKKGNKVFATARGYGEYKGLWEFPGGKIEEGETPQHALVREILEELDTKIDVNNILTTVEYDYPSFHLSMDCYWCSIIEGNLILKEALDARWLSVDDLCSVSWLEADKTIVPKIEEELRNKTL